MAWFLVELRENKELKKATNEKFYECFPGLPKYQQYIDWTGQVAMERLPPDLHIVD
jgi:hypothetical protein